MKERQAEALPKRVFQTVGSEYQKNRVLQIDKGQGGTPGGRFNSLPEFPTLPQIAFRKRNGRPPAHDGH